MLTSSLHDLVEPALNVQLRVLRLRVLQLDGHLFAGVDVDSWKEKEQKCHFAIWGTEIQQQI